MRKLLFLMLFAATTYAETIILENHTSYPQKNQQSRIAIQWVASATEVDDNNKAILNKTALNPASLQTLPQTGKLTLTIPQKAHYFRIVVWANSSNQPDLITNWVDIVPNKTYTLTDDYLVPSNLMSGAGC